MTYRVLVVSLVSALAFGVTAPQAAADEEVGCRLVAENHSAFDEPTYKKVCWLVGSDGSYTRTDVDPPVLYPQLGSDVDGSECWYWTTTETDWVILSRDGNTVTIGKHVTGGTHLDAIVEACEGVPGEDLRTVAWDYLRSWVLDEPLIEFSPTTHGITGLETYVWASIPDRIDGTLTSPLGTVLQTQAWVDQVVVDWGDVTASPLVFNESQLDQFIAYPDGSAFHTYETKTCNVEGQKGCYPEVAGYPVTVSFRWQAVYRAGSGPWIDIGPVVPFATVSYPVDEIIARIETTG